MYRCKPEIAENQVHFSRIVRNSKNEKQGPEKKDPGIVHMGQEFEGLRQSPVNTAYQNRGSCKSNYRTCINVNMLSDIPEQKMNV
jgi:hypothetical protein